MSILSAGMTVYVDYITDSRTEFSGRKVNGFGVLDRVEDGYVFGRLINGHPFMCNEGDAKHG